LICAACGEQILSGEQFNATFEVDDQIKANKRRIVGRKELIDSESGSGNSPKKLKKKMRLGKQYNLEEEWPETDVSSLDH